MKFFIDTANVKEIREIAALGLLDGVTTNPSLVAKEGKEFTSALREIVSLVNGPISAEVTTLDRDEMLRQGREYSKIHPNIVIKVPLTKDGLATCACSATRGSRSTSRFASLPTRRCWRPSATPPTSAPFVGRLDDISHVGMDLIRQIRTIYDNYGFETQILAASIRHPVHVLEGRPGRVGRGHHALQGHPCSSSSTRSPPAARRSSWRTGRSSRRREPAECSQTTRSRRR
jgi:transaldolase